jgi:tRNA pseudouridine55 synthase
MQSSGDRILLIDKPYRWTSFDVVKKLRKILLEEKRRSLPESERKSLKKLKVGHAGTLDPLATGLLILCSGSLTKKISEIQNAEKEYTGTMIIGAVTATYDLESEITGHKNISEVTEELLQQKCREFSGKQLQTPPVHSAVKIEGKRAYEKARKGEEFEIKAKEVDIKEFELTQINLPEVSFRIVCSKGTYIRSLVHDFGQSLGTGAYLSALCRTRIGEYRLEDSTTVENFLRLYSDKQDIT